MAMKATEKVIEALTMLFEGYAELQVSIENEHGINTTDDDDVDDETATTDVEAALVTEMRAALEAVIEAEDYTPDDMASFISTMTEALEEIDPDVFEQEADPDDEENAVDEDDDEYDDDDDDDDDEDDEDEVEEAEEEED